MSLVCLVLESQVSCAYLRKRRNNGRIERIVTLPFGNASDGGEGESCRRSTCYMTIVPFRCIAKVFDAFTSVDNQFVQVDKMIAKVLCSAAQVVRFSCPQDPSISAGPSVERRSFCEEALPTDRQHPMGDEAHPELFRLYFGCFTFRQIQNLRVLWSKGKPPLPSASGTANH